MALKRLTLADAAKTINPSALRSMGCLRLSDD